MTPQIGLPYTRLDVYDAPRPLPRGQYAMLMLLGLGFVSAILASRSRHAPAFLQQEVTANSTHVLSGSSSQRAAICTLLPDVPCGPWAVGISALVGALTGPFVVPLFFAALCCCGFGPAGVVAGSCAACCQTPVTVAGGCFATLQSCGALGCWGASAAVPPLLILMAVLAAMGGLIGMVVAGVCDCDWQLTVPVPHFDLPPLPHFSTIGW